MYTTCIAEKAGFKDSGIKHNITSIVRVKATTDTNFEEQRSSIRKTFFDGNIVK